jgi:hypothetical protein
MKYINNLASFLSSSFLICYLAIFFCILLIYSVLFLILKKTYRLSLGIYMFIALGFGILGLTIGLMVGSSREPAVNTIISSLLTFLGVFATFILSKKTIKNKSENLEKNINEDISLFSSLISLIVMPLCLFYGVYVGSIQRQPIEDYEKQLDFYYIVKTKKFDYDCNVARDSIQHYLKMEEGVKFKKTDCQDIGK